MSEVKRYAIRGAGKWEAYEVKAGAWVRWYDFDAQRLRADTAEAELEVVRQQHAEQSCIFCNDSGELLSKVKAERLRADAAVGDANEADRKLAAAEQRIADLWQLVEKAYDHETIDGDWIEEYRRLKMSDAALNQKSEGESQ